MLSDTDAGSLDIEQISAKMPIKRFYCNHGFNISMEYGLRTYEEKYASYDRELLLHPICQLPELGGGKKCCNTQK